MTTRTTLALTITSILLTACGGGGGSDAPDAQQSVAASDASPFMVVDATDEPAPVVEQQPVVVADQPVEPVVAPVETVAVAEPAPVEPSVDYGGLDSMFGRVTLGYSFRTTTQNFFAASTAFGPEHYSVSSNGLGLLARGDSFNSYSTNGGPLLIGSSRSIGCTMMVEPEQIMCILDSGGPLQTFFRLDPLSNGVADGEFKLCGASVATSTCVTRLLTRPDGFALMTVDQEAMTKRAGIATDLSPYLQYEQQGVAHAPAAPLDAALAASLIDAATALTVAR